MIVTTTPGAGDGPIVGWRGIAAGAAIMGKNNGIPMAQASRIAVKLG